VIQDVNIISGVKQSELEHLFLSLSDKTLYNFTPFGKVNRPAPAHKVSIKQTRIPPTKQQNFGLYVGARLAGFGFLRFFDKRQKRHVCTLGIVMADEFQGRGLANKLVRFMISWARKKGFRKVWLAVYQDNKVALRLYRKLNFVIEGMFKNEEYFGNRPRHVVSLAVFLRPKRRSA
jgi:RimJ/RimL family protein N-acetyltransferase